MVALRQAERQRCQERKLSQLQELIESRLDTDLTLLELAQETGYSRSHFLRVFQATAGMTPHRYVLKRRVERARELLAKTHLSIGDCIQVRLCEPSASDTGIRKRVWPHAR